MTNLSNFFKFRSDLYSLSIFLPVFIYLFYSVQCCPTCPPCIYIDNLFPKLLIDLFQYRYADLLLPSTEPLVAIPRISILNRNCFIDAGSSQYWRQPLLAPAGCGRGAAQAVRSDQPVGCERQAAQAGGGQGILAINIFIPDFPHLRSVYRIYQHSLLLL